MPASLRWLAVLVALSILAALLSGGMLYRETAIRTQLMAETMTGGHVDAGRSAIERYRCGACHVIGGIHDAQGQVGPSLSEIAVRAETGGRLANQPDQMMRWLRAPQAVVPGNGMPDQNVTASDARDIAAYLYTIKN